MPAPFWILLVDDEPHLLDIVLRSAKDGFPEARFIQVHSALEARDYFSQLEGAGPRLVLLDLNLGTSLTGVNLLRELRGHESTHLLPVVMLTISNRNQDVQTSYLAGASSFTRKPETFEAWQAYMKHLREYWLETVTLPPIVYRKAGG